ncbi:MAG: purine-binding chemotaxis protein CheW [bacterium]|nr:purine-binding chemotaxis protein CheW [bacterium]
MAIDDKQYITFKLEENYGIELTRIKEIIRYQELTVVPEAPVYILGILSLRGIAVPVIDLRKLFQLPEKDINQYSVIIVMEILGRLVGMLVDGVSDMINIKDEDITPPPRFTERKGTKFIKGMVEKEKKFIMLLDVNKLFSSDEIEIIDGI